MTEQKAIKILENTKIYMTGKKKQQEYMEAVKTVVNALKEKEKIEKDNKKKEHKREITIKKIIRVLEDEFGEDENAENTNVDKRRVLENDLFGEEDD